MGGTTVWEEAPVWRNNRSGGAAVWEVEFEAAVKVKQWCRSAGGSRCENSPLVDIQATVERPEKLSIAG